MFSTKSSISIFDTYGAVDIKIIITDCIKYYIFDIYIKCLCLMFSTSKNLIKIPLSRKEYFVYFHCFFEQDFVFSNKMKITRVNKFTRC